MDASSFLVILAPIAAVIAAALSGVFAIRARTTEHRLVVQRDHDKHQRDVVRMAEEPFLYAVSDLQSRIFHIVRGSIVNADAINDDRHRTNLVEYTAFLFAQYLGWAEAMRQAVMLRTMAQGPGSSNHARPTAFVSIRKISDTLRADKFGRGFILFAGEQHAIGELMFRWDTTTDRRIPTVLRYAEFAKRFRSEPEFRRWFDAIVEGMEAVGEAGSVARLSTIQTHLVDLMELLDPDHRAYKPRRRLSLDRTKPTVE